jgi:ADP-ribosylglycohydrolase
LAERGYRSTACRSVTLSVSAPGEVLKRISRRELPDAPWTYTDDTEMALSIVEILEERDGIDQDVLATRFADRMQFNRHYGQGTYAVLYGVEEGLD